MGKLHEVPIDSKLNDSAYYDFKNVPVIDFAD